MDKSLGRDLTQLAAQGMLDPVVGREREMECVLRILCRRTKNNPLLLGPPGVGKTALIEGLAQLIATDNVPAAIRGRPLFELQLGSLLAGTQYRGDLEQRLQRFLESAKRQRAVIFIDEIHLLAVAGRGSGMDVANLLKPILARGEVPCIGASTPNESAEMFRTDAAMERRFQAVEIKEPGTESVRAILEAIRPRLEQHHHVKISDEAIEAAVLLSVNNASPRMNPDRAIDLLEDACASLQLSSSRNRAVSPPSENELRIRQDITTAASNLDLNRHVQARLALDQLRSGSGLTAPAHEVLPILTESDVAAASMSAGFARG